MDFILIYFFCLFSLWRGHAEKGGKVVVGWVQHLRKSFVRGGVGAVSLLLCRVIQNSYLAGSRSIGWGHTTVVTTCGERGALSVSANS
jgi:hypothetical protein